MQFSDASNKNRRQVATNNSTRGERRPAKSTAVLSADGPFPQLLLFSEPPGLVATLPLCLEGPDGELVVSVKSGNTKTELLRVLLGLLQSQQECFQ